jgi:hypothetical protein
MAMKRKSFAQITGHDWTCDFDFCADITQNLNELNNNV